MADTLEESFTLEDLEIRQIEEFAELPNIDNLTTCSCRGNCLREKGRNFCACKSLDKSCSSACHGENFGKCMDRSFQESDSSEDTTDSDFSLPERDDTVSAERRGRGRGRGRGRKRGRGRGRGRGSKTTAGRQRGGQRGGRGRGQLVPEVNAAQNQANHEEELANLVEALDLDVLRRLALELLRRQPAAFADLVNGEIPAGDGIEPPDPSHGENVPEWCKCGHCVTMPTQEENKCCTRTRRQCITTTPLFPQLVLDGNVLDIAMRYRADVLVLDNVRNNENFRHAAYRQFVLWQHGHLGKGNRRVVPSCCVTAIRTRYPSPNGIYTGYRPARL